MKKILFVSALILAILLFPQKSSAETENEITVQSFTLLIRKDANSQAEPLGNVKVNIYGVNSETSEQFLLNTTMSDSNGTVTMKKTSAPKKIDQVRFQYYYGNDDRGYLISLKNSKYNANHTRAIPANRVINATRTTSMSGPTLNAEFHSKLTRLNNVYHDIYQNQKLAVEKAKLYINTTQVDFKPINIIYDDALNISGGGFNRYGHGQYIKEPILTLSTVNVIDLKAGVAHEWAHWNMYCVNGMPGGSYQSHYDQVNPYVSYKEGWALFQRHRYTCGLENEIANEAQVQNDDRLFGKSTNFTVKGALYDIYDMNFPKNQQIEKDEFDIYTAFVNGSHSIQDKDLISEGIMYTLMVNSKASTFQEFYTYLMNSYIKNHSDKTLKGKLENAVGINGINKDGSFKFGSNVKALRVTDEYFELPDQISDID